MRENFIEKAKHVHGDKYDYSKVDYVNNNTKVCIICPEHGEFWQTPHNHLAGHGCKKCSNGKSSKERSMTTEEFIEKARKVHGNKYDYSKVNYAKSISKVCIIDPIYGEYWQTPNSHLQGHGHPKEVGEKVWSKRKRKTTAEFIKEAKRIHGDKYDYSKIEYVNPKTKVCVICPKHGEFFVAPYNFLNGRGCKWCGREMTIKKNTLTTSEFIEKAIKVHGDKYDYSKVDYINNSTKVCIIDPVYGEFWQTPSTHLRGSGHPLEAIKEASNKNKLTTEVFIKRAKQIHGNKYDYSKANYVDNKTNVCLICPEHGEFFISPGNHLQGKGCKECGKESASRKNSSTTSEFIEKAIKVHGDKYDYSKVDYYKAKTNVTIICRKHGEFKQMPDSHLAGCGCPICGCSKLEGEIKKLLDENGIIYTHNEKKLNWLGGLELDFFIPSKNIAIECQGIQHYIPSSFSGDKREEVLNRNFLAIRKRDIKKNRSCRENGVKLLYYSNINLQYPYYVFNDKKELLNEILS